MFTPAQSTAITVPTKDILVSAGAGSGKTTVLTERIMEKLKDPATTPNDFLIVTFTKASAADLRKKMAGRIERLISEHPDEPRYQRMLFALPKADIGTIDSFCLRHVKENAVALGLHNGVSVGDGALCEALLTAAADELITELCEADDPACDLLLDNFAGFNNDDGLIKVLFGIYKSIRAYPFYNDWLDSLSKKSDSTLNDLKARDFFDTEDGKMVKDCLEKRLRTAREHLDAMHLYGETDTEVKFASEIEDAFSPMELAVKESYAAFCAAASAFAMRRRPSKTNVAYANAHKAFKSITDTRGTFIKGKEQLVREQEGVRRVISALVYVIKRLDKTYSDAKAERGIVDFADAEQLFLSLLLEKTEEGLVKTPLCRSISASYKEIFIDEYQDVSPLQDAIFAALGRGKRFMVGDLKQSIYGFRTAYPDIFMSYRGSFKGVEENAESAVIYLTDNFRCDEGIIDFCNYLFTKTFTENSADTDYKRERLERGKKEYGTERVHLTVIENATDTAESETVAEQIVKCIYEGFSPSDIAVVAREGADIELTIAALEKRGVPCATEKTSEELFSKPEVLLALSLIKVVDNPTDDISLAALLRSPIFAFTAEELVRIRGFEGENGSFYSNLCAAANEKTPLGEKCSRFLEKLAAYRAKALITPVHTLIWYLYEDTHIFAYAPEGAETRYRDNLHILYELARGMESEVYKGVSVFVDYVNRLIESDRSPAAATAKAEDCVSVMTIHGSKGLEFPVVFVVGTGTAVKVNHHRSPFLINYRLGISVKLANQKEAWRTSTLLRDAAIAMQDIRNVAEEHRLLYVAFTRAEKRLYISTALSKTVDKYLSDRKADPSIQADLFLPALLWGGDPSYDLEVTSGDEEIPCTVLASAMARGGMAPPLPEIKDTPAPPVTVTAKYAVSGVRRMPDGTLGANVASAVTDRRPVFAGGGVNQGALKGTATHAFLQFADYALAEKDAEAEADRLLEKGFISKKDRGLLDIGALEGFFASDLYGEIKASPRVYREKRFSTELPASLFGAEGEEVLVQGVIDCFFENPDGTYTLVDYKTDAVSDDETLRGRYGVQLFLYSLYIKKITGKEVSRAYLYSLHLGKAIPCETEKYGV